MNMNFLSIGQVALLIGVCTKTLRRWDQKKLFKSDFRTKGNHRRYDRNKVLRFIGKRKNRERPKNMMKCAIYGRVSSSRQKKSGDLKRQLIDLKRHSRKKGYKIIKTYSDVGSGLNDKRRGLLKMLKDASLGKFEKIIVNYNDRLARFGLQIIKEHLRSWGVELEVIHPCIIDNSPHAELITDLTAILYSFMGKLYRLRRS